MLELLVTAVVFLIAGMIVILYWFSAEGYQDRSGFHHGKPPAGWNADDYS